MTDSMYPTSQRRRFLLNGGGGRSGAPSGVQGQSPWSGGQRSIAPLKLKRNWILIIQNPFNSSPKSLKNYKMGNQWGGHLPLRPPNQNVGGMCPSRPLYNRRPCNQQICLFAGNFWSLSCISVCVIVHSCLNSVQDIGKLNRIYLLDQIVSDGLSR